MSSSNSRRSFIKKTAAMGAGFYIVPRHVLGGNGYIPPSDQMLLAAIGAGGKGSSDIVNATVNGRERVVALCDVDPFGIHGVTDTRNRFPKANFYLDFRKLLDQEKDLDAVTISTPDHTHGVIGYRAMEQGLHTYIQKPLTHNIEEARMLTEAAARNKVVTQMGNQGASNKGVVKIQEWVDAGLIGKISTVNVWTNRPVWPQGGEMPQPGSKPKPDALSWDLWLGPASQRGYTSELHPFNWRGWWDFGTGALGDMGCHIMDVPYRTLGLHYPTAVECSIGSVYSRMWSADYFPEGCPPSSMVTIDFEATEKNPTKLQMIWMDGGIRPSRPNLIPENDPLAGPDGSNGVMMIGEKGIITCGVYGLEPRLYLPGEEVVYFDTNNQIGPEYQHAWKWIEACKAGYGSEAHQNLTSSIAYAGPFTETVLMGNLAIRSYLLRKENPNGGHDYYGRKKLLWDGEQMRITNLEEANQFVGRTRRPGWSLDV